MFLHVESISCAHPILPITASLSLQCRNLRIHIGETKRPLSVRLDEHKKWTQRGETSKSEHHRVLWDDASVLHREEHWFKRKFKEAAYIEANNAFSQPSVEIKNVWKPLIALSGGLQRRETSRTTTPREITRTAAHGKIARIIAPTVI
ncbi:hypothetical protein JTB14_025596 [Gonioctena quinquepunctata]|nr:hypothetical protein JTB14_025596 [Gonioctena quinquepunctata]